MDYFTADVRRIQAIAPGQQVIELVADERIARLLRNRKIRHVRVGVEDGRSITPLQQRKAYATLRDIGEHTGYPMEDIKEIMKVEHMMRTGDYEHFSLSDCSMTKAREFINTLLEYALKEGIILDESGLMRTDDIDTYASMQEPGAEDRLEEVLKERLRNAARIKQDVEVWINTIPVRMQRIIRYRIFEGMTWEQVAIRMGRGATGDSVRVEYVRFMNVS